MSYRPLPTIHNGRTDAVTVEFKPQENADKSDLKETVPEQSQALAPLSCSDPILVFGIQPSSPVVWSHDGNYIAFVSSTYTVFIGHIANKITLTARLGGAVSALWALAFHPTKNIIAGCGDFGIIIWNINGTIIQQVPLRVGQGSIGHDATVVCLCWIFDGDVLLTGAKDSDVIMWDTTKVEKEVVYLDTLHGHKAAVNYIVFDKEKKRFATAARDSTIKIWDLSQLDAARVVGNMRHAAQRGSLIKTLDGHRGDVCTLTFNNSGTLLFSGARDNTIKLWDMTTFTLMRNISGGANENHVGDVRRILLLPGEKEILTCGGDGEVKLWHIAEEEKQVSSLLSGQLTDKDTISNENFEAFLHTEDISDWKLLNHEGPRDHCIYTRRLFRGCHDMDLCKKRPAYEGIESAVRVFAWQPPKFEPNLYTEYCGYDQATTDLMLIKSDKTDQIFLSASLDPNFYLFDANANRRISGYLYQMSVLSIAISPNAKLLFAAGTDYKILAYPFETSKAGVVHGIPHASPCAILEGHNSRVEAIAISPNGNILVSGGSDFNLLTWDISRINSDSRDIKPGEEQMLVPMMKVLILQLSNTLQVVPHTGQIITLAFNNYTERSLLISGSADHSFIIWENKGKDLDRIFQQTEAHAGVVTASCWGKGPTENVLFTGSWNKEVKAWNIEVTGVLIKSANVKELASIQLPSRVTDLCVDHSGQTLVIALSSGSIVAYKFSVDSSNFESLAYYQMNKTNNAAVTALDIGDEAILAGYDNGSQALWPLIGVKQYQTFFNRA